MDTGLDHLKVVLLEAIESAESALAVVGDGVVNALGDISADIGISTSMAQLGNEVVKVETVIVVVQFHVSEDAVDITGWVLIIEFPLLELSDKFVGEAQFGFALVTVGVQVLASFDCEVSWGLSRQIFTC
jgi:hypothetical protein